MPRASWTGFLRLSLVTCPVYLTPATTEAKRIRLNQLNAETGNRVSQRLVDSKTGAEVGRDQIAKGYEFDRGRYVTLTDEELQNLQIESSKIIDLDRFVSRDEVDPLYLDAPYYIYPDGEIATETFRVIGEAMARTGRVGVGRITLSSRERLVLVEPRDAGLMMSTLRAGDEVRAAEFAASSKGEVDPELVALAETIIERKSGAFEPANFRDRYQDALHALVESKIKGEIKGTTPAIAEPAKVINLMDALKRSLAREEASGAGKAAGGAAKRPRAAGDRRQASLLLPVSGGRETAEAPAAEPVPTPRRRKPRDEPAAEAAGEAAPRRRRKA
ncbi:MAG: Ku protein [Stellaceae bacterium]